VTGWITGYGEDLDDAVAMIGGHLDRLQARLAAAEARLSALEVQPAPSFLPGTRLGKLPSLLEASAPWWAVVDPRGMSGEHEAVAIFRWRREALDWIATRSGGGVGWLVTEVPAPPGANR
jgi:hypothetical protein